MYLCIFIFTSLCSQVLTLSMNYNPLLSLFCQLTCLRFSHLETLSFDLVFFMFSHYLLYCSLFFFRLIFLVLTLKLTICPRKTDYFDRIKIFRSHGVDSILCTNMIFSPWVKYNYQPYFLKELGFHINSTSSVTWL